MKKLKNLFLLIVAFLLISVGLFAIYYFFYIPQYEFSQVRLECYLVGVGGEERSFIELNNDSSRTLVFHDQFRKTDAGTRVLTQEEFDEINRMIKDLYKLNRNFLPGNVSPAFKITLTIDEERYNYNNFDLEAPWYVKNEKISKLTNKLVEYSPIEMKTWFVIHEIYRQLADDNENYDE